MLIRFFVENFMSFKDRIEFSMYPGRSTKLAHHINKESNPKYFSTLKTGLIYGGNASGKSNFVKALAFAQNMVKQGVGKGKAIPLKPFKLEGESLKKPSRFEFEFSYGGRAYAYGFVLSYVHVEEEWLYDIDKNNERSIFTRKTHKDGLVEVKIEGLQIEKQSLHRISYIALDTLPNELFLRAFNNRNIDQLQGVEALKGTYRWITKKVRIIFPESQYLGMMMNLEKNRNFHHIYTHFLAFFNLGIQKLKVKEVDFMSLGVDIPPRIKEDIIGNLEVGQTAFVTDNKEVRYNISRTMEGIRSIKLITIHQDTNNQDVEFEVCEESDGTQRILDLIPALIDLATEDNVLIIDELDRSLHPKLVSRLLQLCLNIEAPMIGQLIATTHDDNLLDYSLLRRDEVWFVQKSRGGATRMYSLEEFKPRNDEIPRTRYLHGRYGGINTFISANLRDIVGTN